MHNTFEHQKFLLRTRPPDGGPGERLRLSWKEIMTGEDRPLRFDYPLEYMNVAAFSLCSALTQAVLEPSDAEQLIERLQNPTAVDEVDTAIAPYVDDFSIDGNVRFLQGPEPARDKKGRLKTDPLSNLLLTVKKGDKEFLNRGSDDWGVALDQIPLLLFSRSTFFEKSAGRGYLTGTSGDLEIRTFPVDQDSLRRSIWLNVLTREQQRDLFTPPGSSGYDSWMWKQRPKGDVAQSKLSLRTGLFWMVANAWIEIESLDHPGTCIVSGEQIESGEKAGTGVVVTPTGIGYGVKEANKAGLDVRRSFFFHPNGPYKVIRGDKIPVPFPAHHAVQEKKGLFGEMGGLFFGTGVGEGTTNHVAPVIDQLYTLQSVLDEDYDQDYADRYDLLCFGFNMLSSKKNVHGGYSSELFHYPILGKKGEDRTPVMIEAERIMTGLTEVTGNIEQALLRGIQRCTLKETDAEVEDGRTSFKQKSYLDDGGMIRDASVELWSHAGDQVRRLLDRLRHHSGSEQELQEENSSIRNEWVDAMVANAEQIFLRYFNTYSASPQHLVAAHNARGLFYSMIRKIDSDVFDRRKTVRSPIPEED